ncbi:S8 family serine peptidase [Serinibacter arcticus]|uniref:S8 family serine peptidase n=1 Tax=Serinibacter arcticus TaxID=1655435 RepID=UPI001304BECE|nr:S8 family serine peptidase [Serinibacter arcticus]
MSRSVHGVRRRVPALVATAALAVGVVLAPATLPSGLATLPHAAAAPQAPADCQPGELIAEEGWAPAAIGRAAANDVATGAGVRVAVVDSGVRPDFPHLVGAVEPGRDVVALDPADSTGTADTFGHGSAVATIIAGRPVEGSALVGIARDATIVPVRVYYEDDTDAAEQAGTDPQPGRIAQGIREASQLDVDIIVVAMSTIQETPDLAVAVDEATAAGSLVVASMGNVENADADPTRPRYPAALPGVLAVGAYDEGFAEVNAYRGAHADVGGPGVGILATGRSGGDCRMGTAAAATSWATAHVAGVAALVAQAHPDETPAQWAYRITATAARSVPEERSDLVGWGLVQAADAIAFVDDGSARGPVSDAVPALPSPPVVTEPVTITAYPDRWATARSTLGWWALGAAVVVAGSLIVARTPRGRGPAS